MTSTAAYGVLIGLGLILIGLVWSAYWLVTQVEGAQQAIQDAEEGPWR